MRINKMTVGPLSTNCYIVSDENTKKAVIIDPGAQADRIQSKITELGLSVEAILLTHGHFDHMMAADAVRTRYQIPILAMEEEKNLLANPGYNLSQAWAGACTLKADRWLKDQEILELAGFTIRVLHTPGHTQGSCCYYLEEEGVLFSGDTLFAGSVGRTDFPTSSTRQMMNSVHMLLEQLPGETKVLSGHGEETTIAYEKRYNPFA